MLNCTGEPIGEYPWQVYLGRGTINSQIYITKYMVYILDIYISGLLAMCVIVIVWVVVIMVEAKCGLHPHWWWVGLDCSGYLVIVIMGITLQVDGVNISWMWEGESTYCTYLVEHMQVHPDLLQRVCVVVRPSRYQALERAVVVSSLWASVIVVVVVQ